MGLSADAYARMLKSLLPRGVLWDLESDSNISKTLLGAADELARIDARGDDLIRELDPSTTLELLADFERVYGLPDPCAGEDQSTQQRIASLVAKVVATGGQTAAYYISVAAALGYSIRIEEFHPHDVEDDVDDPISGDDWAYYWAVHSSLETVRDITVEDTVEDPLTTFGNDQLECVLEELKPAHTNILFQYDEVIFMGDSITFLWSTLPGRNAGVSGERSDQMLARFTTDVLSYDPSVVVILAGTNDVYQGFTSIASVASMASMATAAGACVILGTLPPVFVAADLPATLAAQVVWNNDIKALALANGYHVADYRPPMDGHPEYFADGIHPNAAGYEIMRPIVVQQIDACLNS